MPKIYVSKSDIANAKANKSPKLTKKAFKKCGVWIDLVCPLAQAFTRKFNRPCSVGTEEVFVKSLTGKTNLKKFQLTKRGSDAIDKYDTTNEFQPGHYSYKEVKVK